MGTALPLVPSSRPSARAGQRRVGQAPATDGACGERQGREEHRQRGVIHIARPDEPRYGRHGGHDGGGRQRGLAPRAERAGERDHAHPDAEPLPRAGAGQQRVGSRDHHRRGEEHLADRREVAVIGGGIRPGQGDSSACLDPFDRTRQVVGQRVPRQRWRDERSQQAGRSRRAHGHGEYPPPPKTVPHSDHRGEVAGHSGTGHRRPAPVAGEGSARRGDHDRARGVPASGGQHVEGNHLPAGGDCPRGHRPTRDAARGQQPDCRERRAPPHGAGQTDGESDESDGRGIRHAGAIVVKTRRWAPSD